MKMQAVVVMRGKTCLYGGKRYKEAEHFYMTPQHAKLFCILKQVQLDPASEDQETNAKDTQPSIALVTEVLELPAPAHTRRAGRRRAAQTGEEQ